MANHHQSATWLTSRRLRAHGLLLATTLWSVYVWTLATPGWRDRNGNLKGTDFLHFFTLGYIAAEHRGADLYQIDAQEAIAARRMPDARGIRYLPLYPPQVSILLEPLARLSYGWALSAWWICSAVVYGFCCYGVWLTCPQLRSYGGTVALLAAAFPGFFHVIAWGQTSALALACFTLAFLLMRGRRDFLAGIALGCLIFKPQLGLAAAVVFVFVGYWKLLAGAILSASVQLSVGVFYYGSEPLRQWLHTMWNVRSVLPLFEPRPYQTHCLRTFWAMLLPWPGLSFALFVVTATLALGVTIALWRGGTTPLPSRYSALLVATVLVAPHLTVYDLVILAPAFLLLADWLLTQPLTPMTSRMGTLLYLVYMLPLIGPLTRWTHVQLSVVAMSSVLYSLWSASQVHSNAREARA